jgi:hypothetical protein
VDEIIRQHGSKQLCAQQRPIHCLTPASCLQTTPLRSHAFEITTGQFGCWPANADGADWYILVTECTTKTKQLIVRIDVLITSLPRMAHGCGHRHTCHLAGVSDIQDVIITPINHFLLAFVLTGMFSIGVFIAAALLIGGSTNRLAM